MDTDTHVSQLNCSIHHSIKTNTFFVGFLFNKIIDGEMRTSKEEKKRERESKSSQKEKEKKIAFFFLLIFYFDRALNLKCSFLTETVARMK